MHIFRGRGQFVKHHFEQPHLRAAKCLHYIGFLSQHRYSNQIFDRANDTYLRNHVCISPTHSSKLLHFSRNTTSTVKSGRSEKNHAGMINMPQFVASQQINAKHKHLNNQQNVPLSIFSLLRSAEDRNCSVQGACTWQVT